MAREDLEIGGINLILDAILDRWAEVELLRRNQKVGGDVASMAQQAAIACQALLEEERRKLGATTSRRQERHPVPDRRKVMGEGP